MNDERLSSSNPLQTGRLWFTPAASPNMFVVVGADKQFRYTAHTFRNWTNCEQWVRVTEIAKVSTPRPEDPVVGEFGVGANQSVVYLDAFDPNDVAKNYLAGRNRAGGPGLHSYAFKVPPQRDFVVVESRAAPHEGSDVLPRFDPTIDLYVSGCGEPGSECSTASPTAPSQPTNPTDSSSPTNRSDTSSANPPAASSAANPPAASSPATHTEGTDGTSAPQPGVTSSDSADIQEGAGAACTMSSHKATFGGAGFALVAVAAAAFRRRRSR